MGNCMVWVFFPQQDTGSARKCSLGNVQHSVPMREGTASARDRGRQQQASLSSSTRRRTEGAAKKPLRSCALHALCASLQEASALAQHRLLPQPPHASEHGKEKRKLTEAL